MINNRVNKLVPQPGSALIVLIGSYIFFLCAFSILGGLLMPRFSNPERALRIMYVLQAIFVFVVPALLAALTATRLPARLLCIERGPRLMPVLLTLIVLMVSIPAMNYIIHWNQHISLPESMHGLEESIRRLETQAEDSVTMMMGGTSVGSLIMAILIIGITAGFSEELFFRGALQRIIANTNLGAHAAVWISAFVFSALHLQFFGFVPRLLLGSFFGYLLLWSGSLWLPIIAHIFNNTLATTVNWIHSRNESAADVLNTTGTESGDMMIVIGSALLTVCGIWLLRRNITRDSVKTE